MRDHQSCALISASLSSDQRPHGRRLMRTFLRVITIGICMAFAPIACAQAAGFNPTCNAVPSANLCLAIRTFATEATALMKRAQADGDLRNSLERAWQPVEIIVRREQRSPECFAQNFSLETAANEFRSWISEIGRASGNDPLRDSGKARINGQLDLESARARLLQFCPYL